MQSEAPKIEAYDGMGGGNYNFKADGVSAIEVPVTAVFEGDNKKFMTIKVGQLVLDKHVADTWTPNFVFVHQTNARKAKPLKDGGMRTPFELIRLHLTPMEAMLRWHRKHFPELWDQITAEMPVEEKEKQTA